MIKALKIMFGITVISFICMLVCENIYGVRDQGLLLRFITLILFLSILGTAGVLVFAGVKMIFGKKHDRIVVDEHNVIDGLEYGHSGVRH